MRTDTTRRPLLFERFSSRQGLSQSIGQCLHLDSRGFLWLGTEDGLNRFDGYEFRVFRHAMDDPASLSYSEIKCLAEDAAGGLWVGTFGGLNRLDPASETCRRFVHAEDDAGSLSCDIVRALVVDRAGAVWVGTQGGGLDRLDRERKGHGRRFRHHRHGPEDPGSLAHDDVRALLEDDSGRLWIGTAGGGLDCRDPESGRFRHFRHDPADPGSLSHDDVTALHLDGRGRLWAGTRDGLNRLDPGTRRFLRWPAAPEGLAHPHVTAICEDHGILWIATDGGGLDALDPDPSPDRTGIRHHRHDPRDDSSLSTDRVFSLGGDGAGNLWIGTYGAGGLNKANPGRHRFSHYRCHPDDPQSLCHSIVWSIWEDSRGVLWAGTDGGLDRIDRERGEVTHIPPDPENPRGLVHPGVRVVYEGPSGTLWVGTNGGLQRLDRESGGFERFTHDPEDPASLSHDEIRSLYEDAGGRLWIGTLGGGLNRFDGAATATRGAFTAFRHDPEDPSSLASDFVRPIHEDRRGRLWIGTQGGGLDRLDPRTGRCVHFRHDANDPRSLSSDYVFSIFEDAQGILWLGTYAGGLDRFDPRKGRVTRRYGEADGLPANLIYDLVGDGDGNLWISSNRGLTRFDPRRETFTTFDERDGLQGDEFNAGACHRSPSGELFFGGVNGFNAFFPAEMEDSSFEPPVVLTDFQLFGRSLAPGEVVGRRRVPLAASPDLASEIRLIYRDRVFFFQFAALDFTNPGKNRYAYRMVGFDRRWHSTGASRRFATYTNLPPGRYRFEVRGTNSDGVWSRHTASIRVVIAPPTWGTWWFRSLAATAAAAVAAASYRRRVKTIRLEAEMAAAREAQRSIWPRGDPRLPGFEIAAESVPASDVGGDFFDFVWLDAERRSLCIAIGDVAGKGMSAAMTAVMASGMVASQLAESPSPAGALRRLNRLAFAKASRPGQPARKFTALCLARLDAAGRELCWANAGLSEPLLKSPAGVRGLPTPDPRLPLGIREEQAYREERLRLAPGDVLVLYTDGLPEAASPAGEVYGYAALERHLASLPTERMSAKQILDALLAGARRFTAGGPQQDDMTVVVVKADAIDPERQLT